MNGVIEARIARLARAQGCSFNEAAAIMAKRSALRRVALAYLGRSRRDQATVDRMQSTWYWRRDFSE